jgi:PIN domain nuclease of toxin-antitoxin system
VSEPRFLIDTHILLWDLGDDSRISKEQDEILLGDATKFVSIASIWEIAVKSAVNKLRMPDRLLETIAESDVEFLPILPVHAMHTARLPFHHRDPFDRLLIAQAQIEGLTILTTDRHFAAYGVEVI